MTKKILVISLLGLAFSTGANAVGLTIPDTVKQDIIDTGLNYGNTAIAVVLGIALVSVGYRLVKKFFG